MSAPRGVSVPTVVWGTVLALVAAAVLAGEVAGARVDPGAAAPYLLLGCGTVLVLWAGVGLARGRRAAGPPADRPGEAVQEQET